MGLLGFLTGRDEKEADVYANYDKVSSVVESINSIANDMNTSISVIEEAVNEVNSVPGVGEYIPPVEASAITSVLDAVHEQIVSIGSSITSKADDIKTYEEASWLEKAGSSVFMIGAKAAEGALKVFEDMGDGIVSLVGWVAPKDSGLEKACASFVEKELSHEALSGYYNSEFAKKSAITEDSGIAGFSKFAGQLGTFILLGSGVSKVASKLSKSESTLLKSVGTFAKSEKNLDVMQATLEGMGVGTSEGLKKGLSMDEAAVGGVKQAAIQGAAAWAIGTLVEKGKEAYKAKKAVTEVAESGDNAVYALASGSGAGDDIVTSSSKVFESGSDDALRVASKVDDVERLVPATIPGGTALTSQADNVVAGGSDDALRAITSQGDNATCLVVRNADDVGEGIVKQLDEGVGGIERASTQFRTGTLDDEIGMLAQTDNALGTSGKGTFKKATGIVGDGADDLFAEGGVSYRMSSTKAGSMYSSGTIDSAGVFKSNLDYSQAAAISRIEQQTGVKITMVDGKLLPGTNLPVNPIVEIDGVKYYFSGDIAADGIKVKGASRHIAEHIEKTLAPEYKLNPDLVDKFLSKQGFTASKPNDVVMQEVYSRYKQKMGITTKKLTDAQKSAAVQIVSDPVVTLTDMKKNLAHAGIDITDLSRYTSEQLTQINGEAVMKVYVDGIKDYHYGRLFDGSTVKVDKTGVPTWINPSKSTGDKQYLIEVIAKESPDNPGSYVIFHMDHKSGAIPIQQAARQQGAKMLIDGVSTSNVQYNIVDQVISNTSLPANYSEFLADKSKYIGQIVTGMRDTAVQKVTVGSNAIVDKGLRDVAISGIDTVISSGDVSMLEHLIKLKYEGNTTDYIKGLSKLGKTLAKAIK